MRAEECSECGRTSAGRDRPEVLNVAAGAERLLCPLTISFCKYSPVRVRGGSFLPFPRDVFVCPSPHDICPDHRAVSQQRTFPPAALDFRQHIQRRAPVRANALKFRTVRREYFPGCRAAVLTGADRRKCLRICPKSRAHGFLTDIQRTNRLAYATLFPASVPKKAFRPGIAGFAPRVVCSPPAGRVLPNGKDSLICPQQKSSRTRRELLIVKEITQERR